MRAFYIRETDEDENLFLVVSLTKLSTMEVMQLQFQAVYSESTHLKSLNVSIKASPGMSSIRLSLIAQWSVAEWTLKVEEKVYEYLC